MKDVLPGETSKKVRVGCAARQGREGSKQRCDFRSSLDTGSSHEEPSNVYFNSKLSHLEAKEMGSSKNILL